jgi:GNAT superfamily N-acetyltransferase
MMEIQLRVAGPADLGRYRRILAGTSDEDRYFRFFGHVTRDAALRLERLGENLGSGSLAVVAEDETGHPLGLAHAILEPSRASAELGIIVAGDAQGRGVGTRLLAALAVALRERGCRTLTAQSLEANFKFAHLARANGFRVEQRRGGVIAWSRALGAYEARTVA